MAGRLTSAVAARRVGRKGVDVEAEREALAATLGLPSGSSIELSVHTAITSSCRLALVRHPDGACREYVLRSYASEDELQRHVGALGALAAAGLGAAPSLAAVVGHSACEERPDGVSAIAVPVEPDQAERVCRVLAGLHLSGLAGSGGSTSPAAGPMPGELPLYRLGFTAEERERAAGPTLALQDAISDEWLGPAHGRAISANVVLSGSGPVLLDFASFGVSVQLFDIAAFLLSSGLPAKERHAVAGAYGARRGAEPSDVADLVDAAGLLWGLEFLLALPRREIELMGEDASLEWLRLTARRVSLAIRDPAGDHSAARALREALWPGSEADDD